MALTFLRTLLWVLLVVNTFHCLASESGMGDDEGEKARALGHGYDDAETLKGEEAYHMGIRYYFGRAVPRNRELAKFFFETAGEKGHVPAYHALGHMAIEDAETGGATNYLLARNYFIQSAAQGCPLSAYNVGILHSYSHYGMVDLEQAGRFYQMAAQGGISLAKDKLEAMTDAGGGAAS